MRTLTGIRPTGRLHLGHYFAVIKPALEHGADVLIADLHSPAATEAEIDTLHLALAALGCPTIITQYSNFDYGAYFALSALVTANELRHLIQFKTAAQPEQTAHLLCYPLLQAVDCMGYDRIIVGEDQAQHINYARDWIARFNVTYSTAYPIPEALPIGGRVRDLRHPARKMSKSEPAGCLFLDDSPDEIRKKLKAAVTNGDGLGNLMDLWREFLPGQTWPDVYSHMKDQLADALIAKFSGVSA